MSGEPAPRTDRWREVGSPRIPPAERDEQPLLIRPLLALAGRFWGGRAPNVMTTLVRHGRLFVPWLLFASRLMPRGTLPRVDTELVILRVAHNCRCRYEWDQHVRIGARAGLDRERIDRVPEGPDADGWSERERVLLRAADELHDERFIGDATWAQLGEFLDRAELIELCMLVGHYEMLAGTINSAGIESDYPAG